MSERLVIVLHGVGARGAHLHELTGLLAGRLPGTGFACPDAPEPCDWDPATRQWFSLSGISPRNRAARLRAARAGFDATLDACIAAHGFAGRPERVALVGFSQGASMAVDAVMTGRRRVAGLAALSGRLVRTGPVAADGPPVMLSHGLDDPVIPARDAIAAARHWAARGRPVDLHLWTGLGHWFDARTAGVAAEFLRRVLMPAP